MSGSGIVALGDSLLDTDDSWAHWLARVTERPLSLLAVAGSMSSDVLDQLPGLDGHASDVACIAVGTNDLLFDWDPERFAANLAVIVTAARAHADRVVTQTISLGLRHFAGGGTVIRRRVEEANTLIRGSGTLVVAGDDLRAPRTMISDRIHPSPRGQLLLADRAADLLGIEPRPSASYGVVSGFSRRGYLRDTLELTAKGIAKRALRRPPHLVR